MKNITDTGKSIKSKLWNIAVANMRDKNDNQIYQQVQDALVCTCRYMFLI